MREPLRTIGGWVVWIGGFATGVQFIVYAASAGGALVVAAFAFLLKGTPLQFRVALFVGLSHLLVRLLAWRKGPSQPPADTQSDATGTESGRANAAEGEREGRPSQEPIILEPGNMYPKRSVHLAHLMANRVFFFPKGDFVIHRVVFDGCAIYGPAVLVLPDGATFEDTFPGCHWPEKASHFWKRMGHEHHHVGTITLHGCVFRECFFQGVGVVVSDEDYERLRAKFADQGTTEHP